MSFALLSPSQHPRTCEDGRKIGVLMSRLAGVEAAKLIMEGEWQSDERCKSCAFRLGTVPNGCLQTQMDVMKAVCEHTPFMCHVGDHPGQEVCAGWFAAMQMARHQPVKPCDWPYSKPEGGYDEE